MNNKNRECACGCGVDISHKHPNAKFINKKHKDKHHNTVNPRGWGVAESDEEAMHRAGNEANEEGWDGHKNTF